MVSLTRADRRCAGAVEWFRAWLWLLLWAVLTSGVEPSQRAVGGVEPSLDLKVPRVGKSVTSAVPYLCIVYEC